VIDLTFVYMGVIPDTAGGGTFTDDIYAEPLQQAAALEKEGCFVDFRNFRGHPYEDPLGTIEHFLHFMEGCRDIIYVYSYVFSLPYVLLALKRLKEEKPLKRIALGGLGPNLAPGEIMATFPFIDAIVMGEGERILPRLIEALHGSRDSASGDLRDLPGLCYRSPSGTQSTGRGERIVDLDGLPPAAYHLLDLRGHERVNLLFSRGCPYCCEFCDDRTYWGAHRFERSVGNVLEEVKKLALDYGIRQFIISDNLFALDKKRALALSRGLRETGVPLRWETLTRIDLLDEEIMEAMAESGCSNIMVGIESGSPAVLASLHKRLDLPRSIKALKTASRYFQRITTFFIWGFPFEEMADFTMTLNCMAYLSENLGCSVRLNSLIPFQKTPLYERYADTLYYSQEPFPFDKSCYYIRGDAAEFVRRHPSIFASFHHYVTPDFEKKKDILRTLFPTQDDDKRKRAGEKRIEHS
jgi:anaerobic magnesium-protoporphyrin IX monomethyl ester cyclase